MSAAITAIAADIAREGRPVELRRDAVSVQIPAVLRTYRPHEITGELQQGDREARISGQALTSAGWSGAPRRNDRLVVDGVKANIEACDTRYIGADPALHILTIRI